MDATVSELKQRYFGDDGTFILHSSELKRPTHPKSDRRNVVMFDPAIRAAFFKEFDEKVIAGHNFKLIVCLIRKPEMTKKYFYPADPYYFSFENLMNRVLRYGDAKNNTMFAECRDPKLDAELQAEYSRFTKAGIQFYTPQEVSSRTSLQLIKKSANMNGLQVIDLMLAAFARSELGKSYKMVGNDLNISLMQSKFAYPPTRFPLRKIGKW